MGKLPTGVEIHRGRLRIVFMLDGRRRRRSLDLPPTKANINGAERLRAEILRAIAVGSFRWSTFFPKGGDAAIEDKSDLFENVAEDWFALHTHVAKSTRLGYRRFLDYTWLPEFKDRPVRAITALDIKRVMAKKQWGAKRAYNVISCLRLIFDHAIEAELIETNPCAKLKLSKPQKPLPDPFSQAEATAMLEYLERHEPGWHNYFDLVFHSGLRPSEAIALRWPQADLFNDRIRIERAHVAHEDKVTKTNKARDVRLNSRARAALERQKSATYLAGDHVFLHPGTGEPIRDDKAPRKAFTRALKALGIRHRPAYNARHTYATVGLMAGANPAWMAKQMGHSLKVFFEVYATWIEGQDGEAQMGKVEAFLADGKQL